MAELLAPSFNNSLLFKSIFNNAKANAIKIMDINGYIIQVNPAFTEHFGYTTEDLSGKHIRVMSTEEDRKKMLPEMEIEKVNQLGYATDKNYLLHKDGSCLWVTGESVLAISDDGKYIVKFIQDIHEQKLLEKFLKESTDLSESVIKSISNALIVFDTNFRILKANNAFYNLFKLIEESIEGLYLSEVGNAFLRSNELKLELLNVINSESNSEFQLEFTDQTNFKRFLYFKTSFLDGTLVNKRILLVITDVTDKVRTEQQKDDVIAFVIHELRNPLSNISLCNTIIKEAVDEDDKESVATFIDKSNTSIDRLKKLIQELYEATMAGAGNLIFNKSVFNFNSLVNDVIDSVQLSHQDHLIEKRGDANVEVFADRERIHQTLSNYLLNAIKYSPNANKVELNLSLESGNLIVAVTDYGPGIAEEKIPHIFERYYRVEETKKIEGLGLGLFLCKKIIDAHDGRVWIKSKLKEGSTFYFTIPVKQ